MESYMVRFLFCFLHTIIYDKLDTLIEILSVRLDYISTCMIKLNFAGCYDITGGGNDGFYNSSHILIQMLHTYQELSYTLLNNQTKQFMHV